MNLNAITIVLQHIFPTARIDTTLVSTYAINEHTDKYWIYKCATKLIIHFVASINYV